MLKHEFAEADVNFPPMVKAQYSYRRTPFQFSQFVHRSGSCFVQCLGGEAGYLFLKNRLFLSHRQQSRGAASTGASDPVELKRQLIELCSDADTLDKRWEEILAGLVGAAESIPFAMQRQLSDQAPAA